MVLGKWKYTAETNSISEIKIFNYMKHYKQIQHSNIITTQI